MINAFKLDGCPICRRTDTAAHKYIENILHESVTGSQAIRKLRDSLGFCQAHSQMLFNIGDTFGNAVIYKGILLELLNDLYHSNLDQFNNIANCPVCIVASQEDQNTVELFYHFYGEDEFTSEFNKSAGLCVPHLLMVLNKLDDAALKEMVIKFHIEKIKDLIGHLDELTIKHAYLFNNGIISDEDAAPLKKVIKFIRGMF
ncbi:MAG: DUF6062 family protein [Ignavibacteriaceae bacterium]